MFQRVSLWNKLGHTAVFLLVVHVQQILSQTDYSEDIEYDWSTFLLLVIPVLIILVVLVLCVTGVFMFCLSTLTMNYGQDYYGQGVGSDTPSGDKVSLPQTQFNLDGDLLKYKQSLPVVETVKLHAEDSAPLEEEEDSSLKERTEADLDLEVELAHGSERNKEGSISVNLEDRKKPRKVVIDMEPCPRKSEVTVCLDNTSIHTTRNSVASTPADSDSMLTKSKTRYPTFTLPTSLPTLQHLKLEYYQPQSTLHSMATVGIRG